MKNSRPAALPAIWLAALALAVLLCFPATSEESAEQSPPAPPPKVESSGAPPEKPQAPPKRRSVLSFSSRGGSVVVTGPDGKETVIEVNRLRPLNRTNPKAIKREAERRREFLEAYKQRREQDAQAKQMQKKTAAEQTRQDEAKRSAERAARDKETAERAGPIRRLTPVLSEHAKRRRARAYGSQPIRKRSKKNIDFSISPGLRFPQ